MDLADFLKSLPRGSAAPFAEKLGISRIYLQQLAARQDGRAPSAELCVSIERETIRQVRRWDLRPSDWHRIWPELIGADGAPPVPRDGDKPANDEQARVAG